MFPQQIPYDLLAMADKVYDALDAETQTQLVQLANLIPGFGVGNTDELKARMIHQIICTRGSVHSALILTGGNLPLKLSTQTVRQYVPIVLKKLSQQPAFRDFESFETWYLQEDARMGENLKEMCSGGSGLRPAAH